MPFALHQALERQDGLRYCWKLQGSFQEDGETQYTVMPNDVRLPEGRRRWLSIGWRTRMNHELAALASLIQRVPNFILGEELQHFPLQPGSDGGTQLHRRVRLRKVRIHSSVQTSIDLALKCVSSQGDDRHTPPAIALLGIANSTRRFIAIHNGHVAVHQHHGERLRRHLRQRFFAVISRDDIKPEQLQHGDANQLIG